MTKAFFCSIAFTGKCILQLDHGGSQRTVYIRIINLSMLFLAYLCFEFYTADLISLMTSSAKVPVVRSFQEALDADFKFAVWAETTEEQYLRNGPKGSFRRRAYESIVDNKEDSYIYSTEESVTKILADPKTIYFGNNLPFLGNQRIISVDDMTDRFVTFIAFGLQKNSEFKQLFDYELLKMKQSGVILHEAYKWLRNRLPEKGRSPFVEEATPLGYNNLLFPGLILLVGIAMSLALVFLEFTIKPKTPMDYSGKITFTGYDSKHKNLT